MSILYSIIFFILGLVIGSFLIVVGMRLPKKEKFINSRSVCPKCHKQLTFGQMIPILSYIFLRGKCKHCHKKISLLYPLMELVSGLLFLSSYLMFGFTPNIIIALTIAIAFIIITVSDIKYNEIPNEILIVGSIIIVVVYLLSAGFNETLNHLLSGIIMFGIMFLIKIGGNFAFKKESLGDGDIKLMFMLGLLVEHLTGLLGLAVASFMALPYALISLKSSKSHEIPFGPFLMLGIMLLFFLNINVNDIINIFRIEI